MEGKNLNLTHFLTNRRRLIMSYIGAVGNSKNKEDLSQNDPWYILAICFTDLQLLLYQCSVSYRAVYYRLKKEAKAEVFNMLRL